MRGLWATTALAVVMGTLATGAASAQEASERQYAEADITVTATRRATDTFEVPSVVTVIDAEEIENNLVTDIEDLVRFEPGVSVQAQPARFNAAGSGTGRTGNSSFNIRGLDGNRVLIMVDGVRVPDAYSFSAVTFGRGDYVDVDLLQSVEILRGPASALYGSDGLAGAVAFTTRDPDSFLGDDTYAVRGRVGYASADDSWAESLVGAGRMGNVTGLLVYSRRDGHETENQGDVGGIGNARTETNPQEWSSNAVLGRLVFEPSSVHRFRLTAEYSDRDITSDILSGRVTASGVRTDAVLADDTSERSRVTFDHRYENEGGLVDSINWSVYYQTSEAFQYTFEDRTTVMTSAANDRWRASTYNNEVWGAALQLESTFETGPAQHRLIYGADYSLTTQEAIRDGAPPTAETFPVRPFPNTDYTIFGAYIQDEISFLNGQLILYPAVRFDSYEIDPQDDATYPGTPEGQSESHVSPKFGIVAWPTDTFGAYFSYAAGFKAPAPGQVNEYFENLVGPFAYYRVQPNPDLSPETSDSFEVGLRWRGLNAIGASWQANVAAYAATYEDFIERVQIGGTNTSVDPIVYQYINLTGVEVEGVEARAEANWDNGFGLIVAAAATQGTYDNGGADAPLESVDPWRLVAGLSWDDQQGRFGGQAIVTHAAQKDEDDTTQVFRPDSFTILDLTAYWNITDAATVRLGVFNATDEHYWLWSDVRGSGLTMLSTSPRDAYTQPGRNYSASISYRF